jgi:hypothetical protein
MVHKNRGSSGSAARKAGGNVTGRPKGEPNAGERSASRSRADLMAKVGERSKEIGEATVATDVAHAEADQPRSCPAEYSGAAQPAQQAPPMQLISAAPVALIKPAGVVVPPEGSAVAVHAAGGPAQSPRPEAQPLPATTGEDGKAARHVVPSLKRLAAKLVSVTTTPVASTARVSPETAFVKQVVASWLREGVAKVAGSGQALRAGVAANQPAVEKSSATRQLLSQAAVAPQVGEGCLNAVRLRAGAAGGRVHGGVAQELANEAVRIQIAGSRPADKEQQPPKRQGGWGKCFRAAWKGFVGPKSKSHSGMVNGAAPNASGGGKKTWKNPFRALFHSIKNNKPMKDAVSEATQALAEPEAARAWREVRAFSAAAFACRMESY